MNHDPSTPGGLFGGPTRFARSLVTQRSLVRDSFRIILFLAALGPSASLAEDPLTARLVGNAAFEISDGETTLLTDFPYTSGAHGYLTYSPSELNERANSICLITHSHSDHFDPSLVAAVGCRVLASPEVQSTVPKARQLKWDGTELRYADLLVQAVPSPHMEGHNSYRVTWQDRVLYFTGDTESIAELSSQRGIDWLFISPWLARRMGADRLQQVAEQVVIYHRAAGETVRACDGCLVPNQGDTLILSTSGTGTSLRSTGQGGAP